MKKRKMKDSGIKWIGDIPEHWEIKRIKDAFYRKKSKANQKNPVVLSLARNGVKIRDITNNQGQIAENYFEYNPVEIDDILLNPMDLISGDNCNISKVKGVISPAYVNLRYKEGIYPNFYKYYFKHQYWCKAFFAHGKGVSYENRWTLNNETLDRFPLIFLPLTEQQQIAEFLDKKCFEIDTLSSDIQTQIETLEEYKKLVITETVTKGLNPNVKMKDSGIEWIEKIPEEWRVSRLKYLFDIKKGLSITKENLIDNGLPVISYGQIHSKINTGIKVTNDLIKYVSYDYKIKSPQCEVFKNGFIFADTSEDYEGCGNCVYKRDDSVLFAGYHTIILNSKLDNDNTYLAYLFKTDIWRKQVREVAIGVKVYSITQKILLNSYVILPSLVEQQQIAEHLDKKCEEIDSIISTKKEQLEVLQEYKKSVIYEYVTGKKEVE